MNKLNLKTTDMIDSIIAFTSTIFFLTIWLVTNITTVNLISPDKLEITMIISLIASLGCALISIMLQEYLLNIKNGKSVVAHTNFEKVFYIIVLSTIFCYGIIVYLGLKKQIPDEVALLFSLPIFFIGIYNYLIYKLFKKIILLKKCTILECKKTALEHIVVVNHNNISEGGLL